MRCPESNLRAWGLEPRFTYHLRPPTITRRPRRIGAAGWDRTINLPIISRALIPVELQRHKMRSDLYTAPPRDTVRPQTQAPDGRPHPIGEPDYLTSSSLPLLAKMRLFYTDSHLLS